MDKKLKNAIVGSVKSMLNTLPVLGGVILLIGLSKNYLYSVPSFREKI